MTHSISAGIAAVSLLAAVAMAEDSDRESPFVFERDDSGFRLTENGERVLYYQRAAKSQNGRFARSNYVHPLYGLNGEVLTEDFPADHRHHRGVFWAWHQVLVGDRRIGDPWAAKDFLYDVTSVDVETDAESATLQIQAEWKSPKYVDGDGEPIPVIAEATDIRVHRSSQRMRMIDFDISLTAMQPNVRLGGSEDAKGYGGFSVRIKLPDDLRFIGPAGRVTPQTTAVRVGPWMNFAADDWGVAVLAHPGNPAPRDEWILRAGRSMQNAKYPGREPIPLSETEPLRLRYRMIVHHGELGGGALRKLSDEYGAEG